MRNKQEAPTKEANHTIRLFMEAITYRVPLPVTKVFVFPDNTSYPVCPKCEISLEREYMSFCDRCGQKLNWDVFKSAKICRLGKKRK